MDVVDVGGRCDSNVHEDNLLNNNGNSDSRGRGGRLSPSYTYAGARAPVKDTPGKRPPRPPRPPEPGNPGVTDGGRSGGRQNERPPITNPPDWLKEIP